MADIKEKDIKILWGRSGNRCAICKILLTQDKKAVNASITLGEQAHIVGEKENASRGRSKLTTEERNSYHNLILLCPNHHTEVDKNPEDWPIEKLHLIKSRHELWVMETLGSTEDPGKKAEQLILAVIVDYTVHLCNLEEWKDWTSYALSPDPKWSRPFIENLAEYRQKITAAIWPGDHIEFKRAVQTLSILLHKASQTFLIHCQRDGDWLFPHKFYKTDGWNDNYDKDVREYTDWIDECHKLVKDSTKAVNWFAEVVRNTINPLFFTEKGKFLIEHGPFEDFSFHVELLEFSDDEKKSLPDSILENID